MISHQITTRIVLGLILSVLVGYEAVAQPFTQSSPAQPSVQPSVQPAAPSSARLVVAQAEAATTWRRRFTQLLRRKPPLQETPGTSRGEFCLLSPGDPSDPGETALWNQRPNLIWTGSIAKIEVLEVGASKPLWSYSLPLNSFKAGPAGLRALGYGGLLLEAGKRYEWQAFLLESDLEPQQRRRFSILPKTVQGPITRAWMQQRVALVQAGATAEEQALRQAEFLLEQGLSSDYAQAMVLNALRGRLDGEGQAILAEIVEKQCG